MSRLCVLFFLLFFKGLFLIGELDLVSASDNSFFEESLPGVLYRSKVKEAIKVSSKVLGSWKPLSIFTALDETYSINQTAQSFEARAVTSATVGSITGGIFGPDVFQFYKYSIYWRNGPSPNETKMESQVYFFNLKYFTFRNALDHHDGIVLLNFPIATSGDCPNPLFDGLLETMQQKIKSPGDYTEVKSAFTYRWYVNFPYGSIYHTYRTVLNDEETGKSFTAVVILLPMDPKLNFISRQQYGSTFGKIKGACDSPLMHEFAPPDIRTTETPMETHKGIVVLNIPA